MSECIGTDCPECRSGRLHYLATGCLKSDCEREHGPIPTSHPDPSGATDA